MSLDAIGIVSKDIEKSIQFYEIFGVKLKPEGGTEHYEGVTPSGVRIMVDSVELMKKINPDWQDSGGTGMILCFKQDTPEKVDEVYQKVMEAGFESINEPWNAFWGQRYSSVKDPDGNQIDIFASLKDD